MSQGGGSYEPSTQNGKASADAMRPEAATDMADPAGASAPLPADVIAKLADLEAQVAQLKEERLRALAETENVRRRAARDRQDASQYAISGFANDILSVADNLQRALATIDPATRASDSALDALMSGIEMTERELLTVLERFGVKPIEAEGQPFDPHVHEAMFEIPNEAVPHGTVLHVLQRGYRLHDRTLRPSRVGISRGGPKLQPGEAPSGMADAAEMAAVESTAVEGAEVDREPIDVAGGGTRRTPPAGDPSPATEPGGNDQAGKRPVHADEKTAAADSGSQRATDTDATIIDLAKRAAGEAYPRQAPSREAGSEKPSGSRFDETL